MQASCRIQIPKEHHRYILGPKGKKLADLELATATKITIPRLEDNSDIVLIIGTKEGIEVARHDIQLISDEQVSAWLLCSVSYSKLYCLNLGCSWWLVSGV